MFSRSLGTQRGLRREAQWLQQDGAPPHTARGSLDWLSTHFGDRVISRVELERAPHSPYLSPVDFYRWDHLADRVFLGQPRTMDDLKQQSSTGFLPKVISCHWYLCIYLWKAYCPVNHTGSPQGFLIVVQILVHNIHILKKPMHVYTQKCTNRFFYIVLVYNSLKKVRTCWYR